MFAPAWAALAQKRGELGRFGSPTPFTAVKRAAVTAAARTALRLDPNSGLAFAALSLVEPFGRYSAREQLIRRGLEAAPNDAVLLTMMSIFCAEVGRARESLGFATKARELDPLLPWAAHDYAVTLFYLGLWDEALRIFNLSRDRWPEVQVFITNPLHFAAFLGRWEDFDALAKAALSREPQSEAVRSALSVGRALRDPNAKIQARMLESLREQMTAGVVPLGPLMLADGMRMRDEVFDLIETASFGGFFDANASAPGGVYTALIFFLPSEIFRDVRFPRLCAKLGLCDYWTKTDRWPDCADAADLPYDFRAEARRLARAHA
jgi:tetratricopeptide (TPR) repeat protein